MVPGAQHVISLLAQGQCVKRSVVAVAKEDSKSRLAHLEKTGKRATEVSLGELRRVADAYGIHWLLMDPLLAEPTETCHVQTVSEMAVATERKDTDNVMVSREHLSSMLKFFRALADEKLADVATRFEALTNGEERAYGDGTYKNPPKYLASVEGVAVALVELPPMRGQPKQYRDWSDHKSRSDWHRHPGEEICVILEGSVVLSVEGPTEDATLGRFDMAHYYAEQMHGLRNVGKKTARVFIIRLLPLGSRLEYRSPRYSLKEALRSDTWDEAVRGRSRSVITGAIFPHEGENDKVVGDSCGLGRLLELASVPLLRQRSVNWTKLAAALNVPRTQLYSVRWGKVRLNVEDLARWAEVFRIHWMLAYVFVPSVHSPTLVLRNCECSASQREWMAIPREVVSSPDVDYYYPRYRLAESPVSIAIIHLKEDGAVAPDNEHPGHEFVVVLEGEVDLILAGEAPARISADKHLFGHFESNRNHRIRNVGGCEARVLIVRIFE